MACTSVILRPATVYGPRSTEVVGEIARAMRRGNMVLVDRGRAVAGLCYVENLVDAAVLALRHDSASGEAFNVTDGLDVTWKQFTDDLAHGLGFPQVRWSVPYWLAHGLGTSCETGYRALRRATRMSTPPLLSRQAVHVLGSDQDFSNRKARELLGWEPAGRLPGWPRRDAGLAADATASGASRDRQAAADRPPAKVQYRARAARSASSSTQTTIAFIDPLTANSASATPAARSSERFDRAEHPPQERRVPGEIQRHPTTQRQPERVLERVVECHRPLPWRQPRNTRIPATSGRCRML